MKVLIYFLKSKIASRSSKEREAKEEGGFHSYVAMIRFFTQIPFNPFDRLRKRRPRHIQLFACRRNQTFLNSRKYLLDTFLIHGLGMPADSSLSRLYYPNSFFFSISAKSAQNARIAFEI